MEKWLLIGCGGFLGAVFRYLVSGWFQEWSKSIGFPYGTLFVNMIGCFIIGFASQLGDNRAFFSSESRLFLFIGLLGAMTTFSTFSDETINLLRGGENVLAFSNIFLHLVAGLGMVWLGRTLSGGIWR